LGGREELRVVLKRREDIEAFLKVRAALRDRDVSNVEVVRRLIECYYELRRMEEEEDKNEKKGESGRVEAEDGVEDAAGASGLEGLKERLRRAQRIILRQRLELERMEEYIRAVEDRMARYVLCRSPRRVWRLWRILDLAYRYNRPFQGGRMRVDMGEGNQSLFVKDLKELVELGLLEQLRWGVYRLNFFERGEFIRELGRRMVRREIKRRMDRERGENSEATD
jgi:hypothetical protein